MYIYIYNYIYMYVTILMMYSDINNFTYHTCACWILGLYKKWNSNIMSDSPLKQQRSLKMSRKPIFDH